MTLPIAVPIAGMSAAQLKRLSTCYLIERTDGVTFRFTSHDKMVTVAGLTFTPIAGMDASAKRKESALKDHDVEFRGVISSPAITANDLRAGRFRDAKVTEFLVDWRYPFAGIWSTTIYWIGDVNFNGEVWTCQVAGLNRWLRQRIGSVYTRNCQATLGDSKCAFALGGSIAGGFPATITGVGILGMVDGEKRRVIRANPAQLGPGYADAVLLHGKVTFTAGANLGLSGDIRLYTAATREIELQLPMPFECATTDVITVVVGCDKLRTTCVNRFANVVNFRGEPFLPGTDKVLRITPSR